MSASTGKRPVVNTGSESFVQQQFAEEVDINTIIRRFGLGQAPAYVEGIYGDFTGVTDFYSAREAVQRAERNFMQLPVEVREKFENDPGKFLEYAEAVPEENLLEYLGLRKLAPPPEVVAEVNAAAEVGAKV